MCFYVRIVLPPSSFLHFVTFVLNKLSFGSETVLFLKTTSSIYNLDDGIVNHWLCAVFIPESKARGEAGGVGIKFLLGHLLRARYFDKFGRITHSKTEKSVWDLKDKKQSIKRIAVRKGVSMLSYFCGGKSKAYSKS